MLTRHLTLLLTLTALSFSAVSQNGGYSLFRSFTVADGLPSNHIYNCVEDNQGFLWVATDAGIARFDGKRFQTFTTKEGLPDNDVLDVVKEKNGRIWVSCFKQSPAYFDEVKNRFINAKQDTNLGLVSGTRIIYLTALKDGGVMYQNENGSWIFVNGKLTHLVYKHAGTYAGIVVQKFDDGGAVMYGSYNNIKPTLFYIKDGEILDSLNIEMLNTKNMRLFTQDNAFYMSNLDAGKYYIFSSFQTNPFRCRIDSFSIAEPVYSQRITGAYFTVVSDRPADRARPA